MLFGYIKLLFGWLNLILITILVRINETWRELHWKFISWFIHWLTSLTKYGWSLKLIYRGRLLFRYWSSTGLNKICWKIREGRKKTVVRKEYQVPLIIMYEMLCTILYENQLSSQWTISLYANNASIRKSKLRKRAVISDGIVSASWTRNKEAFYRQPLTRKGFFACDKELLPKADIGKGLTSGPNTLFLESLVLAPVVGY